MARFQIRDDQFGVALYDAESASDALLAFVADRARGVARPLVQTDGKEAAVEYAGVRYRAVPAEETS